MRAVQLKKYDKNKPTYSLNNVNLGQISDDELLIKIKVSAVNPLDNLISHGDLKLVVPYKLPQTMGNEFVGIVEKVGKNVVTFKKGDRVFARTPLNNIGSFAEEIVINQDALAKVPDYLLDEEAAAVPLTALTAMRALDLLNAKAGQTLFISGGTGSFGAMAIPIAVSKGLKVITTGNAKRREEVEKLGVSKFIDYKTEDYTKIISDVDLVIDTVGIKEISKEFSILKKGGQLVSLRAMPNKAFAKRMNLSIFKQVLFGLASHNIEKIAKKKKQKYDFLFVESNGKQLSEAATILANSNVHPAIGNLYSLNEFQDALDDVASGRSKGKVIIKI